MKMAWKRTSLRGWPCGLTLIEVVVGIAIAGTLLVSTLLAAISHRRQIGMADKKLQAVEGIDRFLSNWARTDFSDQTLVHAAQLSDVVLLDSTDDELAGIELAVVRRNSDEDQTRMRVEIVRVEAYATNTSKPISWVEVVRPMKEPRN